MLSVLASILIVSGFSSSQLASAQIDQAWPTGEEGTNMDQDEIEAAFVNPIIIDVYVDDSHEVFPQPYIVDACNPQILCPPILKQFQFDFNSSLKI